MKTRTFHTLVTAAALSVGSIAFAQQAGTSTDGATPRDAANQVNNGRTPMPRDPSSPAGQDTGPGNTMTHSDARGAAAANTQADQDARQTLTMIASDPAKAADRLFVHHCATANLYEVEFARIAHERSQDAQIKELAQHIITDHSKANERLAPAAKELGMTIPTALPSHKQAELAVYRAMPVKNLETCFLVENKAAHAKAVTSYSDHAKTVQNEKLRAYVTETLPKLQHHTQMVVQTAQAKGIAGDIAMQSPKTGGVQSTSTDNR